MHISAHRFTAEALRTLGNVKIPRELGVSAVNSIGNALAKSSHRQFDSMSNLLEMLADAGKLSKWVVASPDKELD